ncbi:MAG: hypothetical protein JOZ37_05950 [Actinobacteria bacterium]|nr:hypothetical protein [Actinomycetota bacterium]MBV8960444.1 hypothetical protein [Actinomycetota bacterium]MBV9254566.1 hypothetical protein [Actinomycetota bacterium]MBV9663490.1 hypothetical protein [Actinomycetota bacterium]MBV9934794.1 hypothetical protein [Actinomycetota bacterium]
MDPLELGLRVGERVRFAQADKARWQTGIVKKIERDGSIGIVDAKGASRAVRAEQVEVRRVGPRGANGWEPLLDRAGRTEQLNLLD